MFHACEQAGQLDSGVGCPVSVVAAVHIYVGAINCYIDGGNASGTELQCGLIAEIHGAVTDIEYFCFEKTSILLSE